MSRKVVVIVLLLALVMAAAAWFLLGPKSASTGAVTGADSAAQPFFDFRPSQVKAIELAHPDGRIERLERDGQIWRLIVQRDGDAPDTWTVASAQMRGLLDVLSRLTPVAPANDARLSSAPLTLTVRLENGDENTLAFDTTAVGGRRLVQANQQPPAYIDQPFYTALTTPGPRGWRELRLFEGVGAETARIEVESDQEEISLARVRGHWFLREPVRAPADSAAIDQLLNRIASLSVTNWIDTDVERSPAATGAGLRRIAVEHDRQGFDGGDSVITTVRSEARFAGAANLGGAQRLVFAGPGRTPGAIAAEALAPFSLSAATYIDRTATEVSPSQVGAIRITSIESGERVNTLERTIDGWSISGDSGPPRSTPAAPVHSLLTLLTSQIATEVNLELPASAAPIAHIELRGFDGGPLEEMIIFAGETGLIIQTSDVYRRYDGTSPPPLLTGDIESEATPHSEMAEPIK